VVKVISVVLALSQIEDSAGVEEELGVRGVDRYGHGTSSGHSHLKSSLGGGHIDVGLDLVAMINR
jgi:hypothetical protein